MVTLVNRAKVATATTGTGTITLGSAESGYQTFADAGVVNADVVRYVIEDGTAWEIGTGTYTATGTTLTRTVSESSNADAAIVLTGSATVFIGATAEDILSNVVEDTTPQLGGNLDVNAKAINFGDSNGTTTNMLTFGVGSDLKIYHDSATNKSHITETGSSHLVIQGQEIQFKNASGTSLLDMNSAQVELKFNGSKKIETETNGVTVTGNVTVSGTVDGRDIATNIPASLGTAGQVLTVNSGASAGEWADAAGGADLYAANESSPTAQPSATGTNAVAIGNSAVASGANSFSAGTNQYNGGSIAGGAGAAALGGSYASGANSFASAIANNTSSYGATGSSAVALGSQARATGNQSLALGKLASAIHTQAVAIGLSSTAQHANAISIGNSVSSTANNQISLGGTADTVRISSTYTLPTADGTANQVLTTDGSGAVTFATAGGGSPDLYRDNAVSATTPVAAGNNGIAIGSNASNTTTHGSSNALAIGTNAVADYWATALGAGTDATGNSSLAVGYNSQATGTKSTAIMNSYASGTSAFAAAIDNNTSSYGAHGTQAIAIGHQAKVNAGTTTGIAIGDTAWCYGTQSIAIGYGAVASAKWAVSLNRVSEASAQGSAALGYNAKASGLYSTALAYARSSGDYSFAAGIGDNSTTYGSKHVYGVALGYQAVTTADKQIALGSSTAQVKVSGAYTLPIADGTANQVLTTDGSGAVTFATAGGGDPDLYADNWNGTSTKPTATGTNSVAIGNTNTSTGTSSVAIGHSSGSSGNGSIVLGQNAYSTGTNTIAIGNGANAGPNNSVAIGEASATSTGYRQTALGYNSRAYAQEALALGMSRASGISSFAAQISDNGTSYGAQATSSIAIGKQAKATGAYGTAIGEATQATASNSVCMGYYSQATGQGSLAFGYDTQATGLQSTAIGLAARNPINGSFKFAGGKHQTSGDSQTGIFPLLAETTDATATAMVTYHNNSATASTDNQVVLPNNSAYFFSGTIIAREQASAGTDVGAWEIKGAIRREANAASTVLIKSTIDDFNVPTGWAVALTADTTNGGLAITVTGAASTNIRWVATVNTSEVTY